MENLKRAVQTARAILTNLFFPIECLCCDHPHQYLCQECVRDCLTKIERWQCPVCDENSLLGATHAKCKLTQTIDGIFAACPFNDLLIRSIIKKIKYKNTRKLAGPLADLLALCLKQNFSGLLTAETVISYVPLHPQKETHRGYNQSQLIAEELGLACALPCRNLLTKITNTESQTKLNREQRKKNVINSFRIDPEVSVKEITVLLVDDVSTTGATLKECARVLKRHGARIVWGVAVAQE